MHDTLNIFYYDDNERISEIDKNTENANERNDANFNNIAVSLSSRQILIQTVVLYNW